MYPPKTYDMVYVLLACGLIALSGGILSLSSAVSVCTIQKKVDSLVLAVNHCFLLLSRYKYEDRTRAETEMSGPWSVPPNSIHVEHDLRVLFRCFVCD